MAPALFLIDGNSLVYRAFFALPESIATSTGEPTNAIFGFASMLVKLITDHGVTPTVVAWDAGTSGRTEVYPDYKAQRRSRPDLLREQWPAFEPLVDGVRLPQRAAGGLRGRRRDRDARAARDRSSASRSRSSPATATPSSSSTRRASSA